MVDIPKDIQFAKGIYTPPETAPRTSYRPVLDGNAQAISDAVRLLVNAKKPVIYSGGGVINSGPAASVCCAGWSRSAISRSHPR